MQLVSRGKAALREELHAVDSGFQSGDGCGAIIGAVLDRFHDDPDALLLAQFEIPRGLEDTVRIDGFGGLGHGPPFHKATTSPPCWQRCDAPIVANCWGKTGAKPKVEKSEVTEQCLLSVEFEQVNVG
jgi:hypothetical protein